MAALCVQAIWMTRAHSISSRGLAPSMNAKLAFTAISQIPLFGSRAAAGVGARPTAEMIKPSRYGGTANRESCRWRRRQPRLQAPHQSQWFGPFGRPRLLHAIACSVTASFTNHGAIGQCARRRTAPRHTVDGQIAFGETHLFVGPGYVVSVRHGASISYAAVRERCESCPAVLSHGEDYILYSILDFIVDNYTPVVEALHAEVEETEETVFSKAGAPVNVQRLYMVRRDLLRLRNAVVPLVDVCRRLEHAEVIAIDAAMQPLFRDVTDHILRVQEEIDSLREVLAFAFEASLMTGQAQQTAITRKLAAWAAILAVPTAIAGTVPARCAAEVARYPGREGLVAPRQEWHRNYGADTGVERKWPSAALLTSRSRHDA